MAEDGGWSSLTSFIIFLARKIIKRKAAFLHFLKVGNDTGLLLKHAFKSLPGVKIHVVSPHQQIICADIKKTAREIKRSRDGPLEPHSIFLSWSVLIFNSSDSASCVRPPVLLSSLILFPNSTWLKYISLSFPPAAESRRYIARIWTALCRLKRVH